MLINFPDVTNDTNHYTKRLTKDGHSPGILKFWDIFQTSSVTLFYAVTSGYIFDHHAALLCTADKFYVKLCLYIKTLNIHLDTEIPIILLWIVPNNV